MINTQLFKTITTAFRVAFPDSGLQVLKVFQMLQELQMLLRSSEQWQLSVSWLGWQFVLRPVLDVGRW